LGNARRRQKRLATIQFFGEYRNCELPDIPRFAGTPTPPLVAGFVFLGFDLLHESRRRIAATNQNPELICPIREETTGKCARECSFRTAGQGTPWMKVDLLFVQFSLIFLPGLIWAGLDSRYALKPSPQNFNTC
jgi:hypothetical protein